MKILSNFYSKIALALLWGNGKICHFNNGKIENVNVHSIAFVSEFCLDDAHPNAKFMFGLISIMNSLK